jgi:hypothetical protein
MLSGDESANLLVPGPEPKLYKQRWLWLLVYFLITVVNGIIFITFGPIDVTTSAFFDQSLTVVNVTTGVGTVFW